MPTPIKYHNPKIQSAYKEIEKDAACRLLDMLPEDLGEEYRPFLIEEQWEKEEWKLVKAADKLSALIKCIEEEKAGNQEFGMAKEALEQAVKELDCPEAFVFCEEFLPMYYRTLDEL
jgi:5'-deoxynucleotidase